LPSNQHTIVRKEQAGYDTRFSGRIGLLVMGISCAFVFTLFADDTLNKMIADKKYEEALKYVDDKIPARVPRRIGLVANRARQRGA